MRALLSSHNACVLLTLCQRRATAGGCGLGYGCGCGGCGGGNGLFRIGVIDLRYLSAEFYEFIHWWNQKLELQI